MTDKQSNQGSGSADQIISQKMAEMQLTSEQDTIYTEEKYILGLGPSTPRITPPPPPPFTPSQEKDDAEVDAFLSKEAPFIHRIGPCAYEISPGHVKCQHAPARFFASPSLLHLVVDELDTTGTPGGSFTAALSNYAT